MKFMVTWKLPAANNREAINRFLATGGTPPAGLTSLGRWHAADVSGGWHLVETNDPKLLHQHSVEWADLLDLTIVPVLDDADAGAVLGEMHGQ